MIIFIAGARALSKLDKAVEERIQGICDKGMTIILGDANGIDKSVQRFLADRNYSKVIVFASGNSVRNNLGKWSVNSIVVDKKLKGFDFYQQKDIAMAKAADYGFMIWNGESRGTLSNIINLISENKKTLVYFSPTKKFICVSSIEELQMLLDKCPSDTKNMYSQLREKENESVIQQLSMFAN